jgi:LEA14-like dessication related protein
MQANTKKIILPIILGAGFLVIDKVLKIKDFLRLATIELKNINIKSENLRNGDYSKIIFDLILILKNPTKLSGQIQSIYIDVYINGKKFANVKSAKAIEILPMKAITFHNDITIKTENLPIDLYNIIAAAIDNKNVNFNFVGVIRTNLGSINIDKKQTVTA